MDSGIKKKDEKELSKKNEVQSNNRNTDLTVKEQIAIFADLVVDQYLKMIKTNGSKQRTTLSQFPEQKNR